MEAWSNVYCSVLVLVLWRPTWRLHVDAAESPVRTLVCSRNESQALLELEMELLIVNETDELINIGQWHCWTVLGNFSVCSTSASVPADIAPIQQKLLETTTPPSLCEECGGRIWKEIFTRASDKLSNKADHILLLLTQNRSNISPPPATTGRPPILSLNTSGQQGTPKVYVAEVQRMSRRSLVGIVNCSWSMGKHKSSAKAAAAAGNSPLVGGGTTVQSVRSLSAGAGGVVERGPPGREVNHGEQDNDKLQNLSKTSVIFVCVSFIILMAISLAWLVFYYIQRFRYAHAKDRLARRLFNAAKKALSKIPTKALTRSDGDELDSDCPVCIEPYRPGDLVRVLPCHHVFHKTCVDPWLLEHRTCPMCKGDILKAFGYHFHTGEESSLGGRRPSSAAPRTAGRVASAGGGAAGGVGGGGGELSDRSSDDGQPSSLPDYPFPSGADSDVPDPFSFSPPNSPTIVQQVLHQGNVQAFTIIPLTVHGDSAAVTRRPASRGQVDLSRQREDVGSTSESTCVGRQSTQVQIHHQQVAEEEEEEVKKGISAGKAVDSASSISSSSAGSSAPLVQKDNTADRLTSSNASSSGPFEPNFGDDPFVPTPGAGDDFDARQKSNGKEAVSTERAKQQQQKPLSRRSGGGGEKRPSTTFHSKTWSSSRRRAARNRSPTSRRLTMTMTRTTSSPNRPQTTTTTGQEFGSLESL